MGVSFEERAGRVELRPEMATLNPCTMTFGTTVFMNAPADVERLARRMQELEVKPELEIYDTGHLDEQVDIRRSVIQGSTVPRRTSAPNGIKGSIAVLYQGATFSYCPNGTCVKTFQPRLAWIYGLDGSRTYTGNVR